MNTATYIDCRKSSGWKIRNLLFCVGLSFILINITQPCQADSADLDGDGMTDSWEISNGLNPYVNDTAQDIDFDMVSNLEEFLNELSPTNGFTHADTNDYQIVHGAMSELRKNYYDPNDQLVGQRHSGGWSIGYRYDGNGNLIRKTLLGQDINADGISDLHAFMAGLNPTNRIDRYADSDGDGWSDGQEIMGQSSFTDDSDQPEPVGQAALHDLSLPFPFKPTGFVMAVGNLDDLPGDEVVIGADGDPGETDSWLYLLSRSGNAWTSHTIAIGANGITSLSIGDPGTGQTAIYCGTRNVVEKGALLEIIPSAEGYDLNALTGSFGDALYVLGVHDGYDIICSKIAEAGNESMLYSYRLIKNKWEFVLFDQESGDRVLGTLIDTDLGAQNGLGASARLLNSGGLQLKNTLPQEYLTDGLELYLPFDGDADDYGPVQRNGSVVNATLGEGRDGITNGAYHFNGGYVQVSSDGELSFDASSENFTISLWIKPATNHNGGTLIRNIPAYGYKGYSYNLTLSSSGVVSAALSDLANVVSLTAPSSIDTNVWTHIAFRVFSGNADLYVNGTVVDHTKVPTCSTANKGYVRMGEGFEGAIDEVRIFSWAKKPHEIIGLSENFLEPYLLPEFAGSNEYSGYVICDGDFERTITPLASNETNELSNYHYVRKTGSTPVGTNWISISSEIQTALDNASDGDVIIVHDGTYSPIVISKQVTIQSVNGRNVTIIDAQQNGRCVDMQVSSTLRGLTIRNGRFTNFLETWREDDGDYNGLAYGAGVYMQEAGILEDCSVSSCSISINFGVDETKLRGAGIYAPHGAVIRSCFINNNKLFNMLDSDDEWCRLEGAGAYLYNAVVENTIFQANQIKTEVESSNDDAKTEGEGAALHANDSRVIKCDFLNNIIDGNAEIGRAEANGGAVDITNVLFIECQFVGNQARAEADGDTDAEGGAASGGTFVRCRFNNNEAYAESDGYVEDGRDRGGDADAEGGAVRHGKLINCILYGNRSKSYAHDTADSDGSGASYSTLINSVVANNYCYADGDYKGKVRGAVYRCTTYNSIVMGNTYQIYGEREYIYAAVSGGKAVNTISYNNGHGNWQDDVADLSGCMSVNPMFGSNFRLSENSPAIDAGGNGYNDEFTDYYGNDRLFGARIDIGAHEYGAPVYVKENTGEPDHGITTNPSSVFLASLTDNNRKFVISEFVTSENQWEQLSGGAIDFSTVQGNSYAICSGCSRSKYAQPLATQWVAAFFALFVATKIS